MTDGPGTDASYCILHVSDTHFRAEPGTGPTGVDADTQLERVLQNVLESGIRPDAIVLTGDLADDGEPAAYQRLRALVVPFANTLATQLLMLPGNHDDRAAMREHLFGVLPSTTPIHASIAVRGLRIIGIDTTLADWHHGLVEPAELEWLAGELAQPAPDGTILALHHPPVRTRILPLQVLELQEQDRLAEVVSGSDVRMILGGHLHYPTASSFAGIPVFAGGAVSTFIDPGAPADVIEISDGFQSFTVVTIDGDHVTASVTPVASQRITGGAGPDFWAELASMDEVGRLERWSRKR